MNGLQIIIVNLIFSVDGVQVEPMMKKETSPNHQVCPLLSVLFQLN